MIRTHDDMRENALAWLDDDAAFPREKALNEQHLALDVIDLLADLTRLTSALAEAERERDEARKHLDERIRWQLEAVLNLQTFRALFDAACLEREEAGCYESDTEPPCGECIGCKFIAAVDQAKVEITEGVDEFIQESAGFWGRFAAKMQKERDTYRAGLADLLAATKDAEPTTSLTYYRNKARDLLRNGPIKETSDV